MMALRPAFFSVHQTKNFLEDLCVKSTTPTFIFWTSILWLFVHSTPCLILTIRYEASDWTYQYFDTHVLNILNHPVSAACYNFIPTQNASSRCAVTTANWLIGTYVLFHPPVTDVIFIDKLIKLKLNLPCFKIIQSIGFRVRCQNALKKPFDRFSKELVFKLP